MNSKEVKILVVEDMKSMRTMIKAALRKIGYKNLIEAKDGLEAFNLLHQFKDVDVESGGIALVVADWNMPVKNGLELLNEMRSSDELKHIPFIMLTAESDKTAILEAVKSGVNGYIVKPFDENTMKIKIENVLQKSGKG